MSLKLFLDEIKTVGYTGEHSLTGTFSRYIFLQLLLRDTIPYFTFSQLNISWKVNMRLTSSPDPQSSKMYPCDPLWQKRHAQYNNPENSPS